MWFIGQSQVKIMNMIKMSFNSFSFPISSLPKYGNFFMHQPLSPFLSSLSLLLALISIPLGASVLSSFQVFSSPVKVTFLFGMCFVCALFPMVSLPFFAFSITKIVLSCLLQYFSILVSFGSWVLAILAQAVGSRAVVC